MGSARLVPNGHGTWASGVLVNADLDNRRQGSWAPSRSTTTNLERPRHNNKS